MKTRDLKLIRRAFAVLSMTVNKNELFEKEIASAMCDLSEVIASEHYRRLKKKK